MIQQLLDVQFLFRAQIQKHRCALAHPHFLSLWTEYLCVFVCVNVRVCSAYIMNQNNIQSEQSYPNSSKIHELFLEKLIKVFKNTRPSHNVYVKDTSLHLDPPRKLMGSILG